MRRLNSKNLGLAFILKIVFNDKKMLITSIQKYKKMCYVFFFFFFLSNLGFELQQVSVKPISVAHELKDDARVYKCDFPAYRCFICSTKTNYLQKIKIEK